MLAFISPQSHNQSPASNAYSNHGPMYGRQPPPPPPADMGGDTFRERIRELAQQRARKAQWLPDEVDDIDEELDYSHLGPHERSYLEALKMQQNMDRMRNGYEARAAALQQEAERFRQAEEERARKLEREAMDARQKAVEQRIRQASEMRAAAWEREANLRAEHMRKQRNHNPSTAGRNPSRSRPYTNASVPVNVQRPSSARSSSPPLKANPDPDPKSQSRPNRVYAEKHETAASVIQQKFRVLRSLRTVSNIASEFQTLKSGFVYPSVIDFQRPGPEGDHIVISVPTTHAPSEFDKVEEARADEGESPMEVDELELRLAYTPDNYPVHSYVDATEKLLMRLDGVESWGDKSVRERRRSVVREIGEESAKLERYWKQAWIDYAEKQKEGARKEEEEEREVQAEQDKMEIDEELVHVEHPKVEDNDEWLDVAALAPLVANPDAQIEIGARQSLSPSLTASTITSTRSTPTLIDEAEERL